MPHLAPLLFSIVVALLLPLLLVAPAQYRGRVRARAGKLPGWEGPGWKLWHVWMAFACLIVAELLVFYLLQPEAFARWLGRSSEPLTGILPATEPSGRQLLWSSAAVGSILLFVLPLAPWRMLWTRHWRALTAIGAGALAFLALRLIMLLAAPALPTFGSEEHPQYDLTEGLSRLASQGNLALTVFVVVLLAPLAEEVLFRGVTLTGLARHVSFGWANAIQAALFATLHLSATLFPIFFIMGLMGGELVRRSGGLLAPLTLHVLNNGAALLALWWLARPH